MPWSYNDFLRRVRGCVVRQITNEQRVSVRKKLSIYTSRMSLTKETVSCDEVLYCVIKAECENHWTE